MSHTHQYEGTRLKAHSGIPSLSSQQLQQRIPQMSNQTHVEVSPCGPEVEAGPSGTGLTRLEGHKIEGHTPQIEMWALIIKGPHTIPLKMV